MLSFKSFLQQSKKLLQHEPLPKIYLVFGNEACDLDSIVTSTTYSYFQFLKGIKNYVPLIPIGRAEVKYRTEVTYLCNKLQISEDEWLFKDEWWPTLTKNISNISAVLVDHNVPTGDFEIFKDKVIEIIDHHEDMNAYPTLHSKQIEMIGSCSTLVALKFLEDKEGKSALENDEDLRILFLATILLDTGNLDPKVGKARPADDKAYKGLMDMMPSYPSNELYKSILQAKFDTSTLTTEDLLQRDYKTWTVKNIKYGISSVTISLQDWLKKDNEAFIQKLSHFKEQRKLDILLVMLVYSIGDDFHRELILYSDKKNILDQVSQKFEGEKQILNLDKLDFNLANKIKEKVKDQIIFYTQRNTVSSRKQVQPLIHSLINSSNL